MHYHTVFGDPTQAVTSATWLLEHLELIANLSDRLVLRSDIAYSLRINGLQQQAYGILEALYPEVESAGMSSVAALGATSISLIAFDYFDDIELAAQWLDKALSQLDSQCSDRVRVAVLENLIRLAIVAKDVERAIRCQNEFDAVAIQTSDPTRLAYRTAMYLGVARICNNESKSRQLLETGLNIRNSTSRFLGQNFFVGQLVETLILFDRSAEARTLLAEHIRNERRAVPYLPRYLTRHCDRLGIDDEVLICNP